MSSFADLPVPSQGPSRTVIKYKTGEVCLLWDDGEWGGSCRGIPMLGSCQGKGNWVGAAGVRCLGVPLTSPVLLPGPRVDYYQLEDADDDGNDDYDYDENEFDTDYEDRGDFWDVPVAEGSIPYSYCGFRKSFLCSEPPPQLPQTSPTALDALLDRLPTPCRTRLTAEVGNPRSCSPGAGGSRFDITGGVPPRGPGAILTQGIPPAGSREEREGAGGGGGEGEEEGREEEAEEEGD